MMNRLAGLALVLVVLLMAVPAFAQSVSSRRDAQGPVTVTVTLLPVTNHGPLRIRVALDTHSVALDAVVLEDAVALRGPAGDRRPSAVEAKTGSGHHREAVIVFNDVDHAAQHIDLVVKNVGGIAERVLKLEMPKH